MGFFDGLKSLFAGGEPQDKFGYWVYVRCSRCGEGIKTRIDLRNDLSALDDGGFVVHKVLVGKGRCFQRVDVKLTFGERRDLADEEIQGGEFITAAEYDELEQAAQ